MPKQLTKSQLGGTSCIGRQPNTLPSIYLSSSLYLNSAYITSKIFSSFHHYYSFSCERGREIESELFGLMKLAMVSLQPVLSPNRRKSIQEFENLSKKRKLEGSREEQFFEKRSKRESTNSVLDIELQYLETPLPLEWQRCLDIQSGQIHFYNTRTHKRTSRDPRRSPEPEPASPDEHMSLELQLSILPCESLRKSHADDDNLINRPALGSSTTDHHQLMESNAQVEIKGLGGSARSTPSWLAFDIGDDQHEMVATVCTRCHMLVMLCKSSPCCPNCKFIHPPDQGTPTLFKRRCTLFC